MVGKTLVCAGLAGALRLEYQQGSLFDGSALVEADRLEPAALKAAAAEHQHHSSVSKLVQDVKSGKVTKHMSQSDYEEVLEKFNAEYKKSKIQYETVSEDCYQQNKQLTEELHKMNGDLDSTNLDLNAKYASQAENEAKYHSSQGSHKALSFKFQENEFSCNQQKTDLENSLSLIEKNLAIFNMGMSQTSCASFLQCGHKITLNQASRKHMAKLPAHKLREAESNIADRLGLDEDQVHLGEGEQSEDDYEADLAREMKSEMTKLETEPYDKINSEGYDPRHFEEIEANLRNLAFIQTGSNQDPTTDAAATEGETTTPAPAVASIPNLSVSPANAYDWSQERKCKPNDKIDCAAFMEEFGEMKDAMLRDIETFKKELEENERACSAEKTRLNVELTVVMNSIMTFSAAFKEDGAAIKELEPIKTELEHSIVAFKVDAARKKKQCARIENNYKANMCALNMFCHNAGIISEQPPPSNCMWSDWKEEGTCSVDCGGGMITSKRIKVTEAAHGGRECEGEGEHVKPCNLNLCPIDCQMEEWAAWGKCDRMCGGGGQVRTRKIIQRPKHSGVPCPLLSDNRPCNDFPCTGVDWDIKIDWLHELDKTNHWAIAPDAMLRGLRLTPYKKCRKNRPRNWIRGGSHCIEEAFAFQPKSVRGIQNSGVDFWESEDMNFVMAMRKKGWVECKKGFFIQGFYRGEDDAIASLSKFRCVRPKALPNYGGKCKAIKFKANRKKNMCPEGMGIAGIKRKKFSKKKDNLRRIKRIKCCPFGN